jgi:hypothetical protein
MKPAAGESRKATTRAERNGVRADAVAAVVDGDGAGEAFHGGLGSGVRKRSAYRALGLVRGDVDDRPRPVVREQVADGGRAAGDGKGEVGRDRRQHLAGEAVPRRGHGRSRRC